MMEEGGQGEEEGPAGGREGERVQVAATRGSRGREGRTGSGGVKGRRDGVMEGWPPTLHTHSCEHRHHIRKSFAPYSSKRQKSEMKQHINNLHFDVSFSKITLILLSIKAA